MKTAKITTILLLMCITGNIYAQVSGYRGKKNVISASLFMKNSFVMPNKNGEHGYFSYNDHYSIELERVINRKHSFKFHATTFKTKFMMIADSDDKNFENSFSANAFGIDYLWYKPSSIAPLGAYFSAGFDIFQCNVNIDTVKLNTMVNNYYISSYINSNNYSILHYGANIKSGVKQIFFNCLSLDINFQLGFIFSKTDIFSTSDSYELTEKLIDERVGTRLWGHYTWGVNCSLGFVF